MFKKLAKKKYQPNNFQIVENGDHVICAISGKIPLESLTYWSVDHQEAYYSYVEAAIKREKKTSLFPSIVCPNPLIRVFFNHIFQNNI